MKTLRFLTSFSPEPNRQTSETLLLFRAMPTTDEWNEKLRCPKCGKTGMAILSQRDDADIPTVQSVPQGFKVVATSYGPNFHCGACKVAVLP